MPELTMQIIEDYGDGTYAVRCGCGVVIAHHKHTGPAVECRSCGTIVRFDVLVAKRKANMEALCETTNGRQ